MRWKQADFLVGLFVIAGFALILAIIIVVRGQIGAPVKHLHISRLERPISILSHIHPYAGRIRPSKGRCPSRC